MSEAKRRRIDDDGGAPPLYALRLECPVCFGRLGYERGMVMGVTTCQPIAHWLCAGCFAVLQRLGGARPNCPLCRQPVTSFLPLAGLTDVEADSDAAAALKLLVAARAPVAAPPVPVAHVLPLQAPPPPPPPPRVRPPNPADLRQQRERFACDMINELLTGRRRVGREFTRGDAFRVGSAEVPRFESTILNLRYGMRARRVHDLRTIALDLLPALRARFAEFTIEIDEGQVLSGSRLGYLVYKLTYVGAPAAPPPPPPVHPEPLPGMLAADYAAQVAAYERAQTEAADRRLAEQLQAQ
jgi:hypothetical protein